MLGINMMSIGGFLFGPIIKLVYKLYFAVVRAIAWILDMLTQLFFIFSGMTPVSSPEGLNEDGIDAGVDILNFFIQQKKFTSAYFWLCLVALGLIIVFTIGKIIKQDYFDRSGPRSKAPIFRSVALSFIAFICVIPVFMFLLQASGALALLVMRALGYSGGGIGSMLFFLSWEDGGADFLAFAEDATGNLRDMNDFSWIDNNYVFYDYMWNQAAFEASVTAKEFYWWAFLFTGLVLIVNLGKMMVAMVTRLYKLIALFIIAPSPISQIVLDDGQKFKRWKDLVIQEALKVVGCVMCFLIFMLVATSVPTLDLMKFAYSPDSAGYISLIEGNSLTSELSNGISQLYYHGDTPGRIDNAVNALGKCMLLIAGVGAIQDMDTVITPLLSGGSSSMEMGNTGKAITTAAGAAAKGALEIGKKGVGLAVGLGETAIGSVMSGIKNGKAIDLDQKEGLKALEEEKQKKTETGGGSKDPVTGKEGEEVKSPEVGNPKETEEVKPEEKSGETDETVKEVKPEEKSEETDETVKEVKPEEKSEETDETVKEVKPEEKPEETDETVKEVKPEGTPEKQNSEGKDPMPERPTRNNKPPVPTKWSDAAMKKKQASNIAWTTGKFALKSGKKIAGTGLSALGILGKTLLQMTGMGGIAKELENTAKEGKAAIKGYFGKDKNGHYNSHVGALFAKGMGALGAATSGGAIANRQNKNFDKLDEEGKTKAHKLAEKQLLNEDMDNINDLSQTMNLENEGTEVSTSQLVEQSEQMVEEAENLGAKGTAINNEAGEIGGEGAMNEQLKTSAPVEDIIGAEENYQTAQTRHDNLTHNNVEQGIETSEVKRRQRTKSINEGAYKSQHHQIAKLVESKARVNGFMELAEQHSGDEKTQNEILQAYLYETTGEQKYKDMHDKYVGQAEKTKAYAETHANKKTIKKGDNDHENLKTFNEAQNVKEREFEEKFKKNIDDSETEVKKKKEVVDKTRNLTKMDKHNLAVYDLKEAQQHLAELQESDGYDEFSKEVQEARQDVVEASQRVQETSAAVHGEMTKTYNGTTKISNHNRKLNNAFGSYKVGKEKTEGAVEELEEKGFGSDGTKNRLGRLDAKVQARYDAGKKPTVGQRVRSHVMGAVAQGRAKRKTGASVTKQAKDIKEQMGVEVEVRKRKAPGSTSGSAGTKKTSTESSKKQSGSTKTPIQPKKLKAIVEVMGDIESGSVGQSQVNKFVSQIENISTEIEPSIQISAEQFSKIFDTMTEKKLQELATGAGYNDVSSYKTGIQERYEEACKGYSQLLEQAKDMVKQYSQSPDNTNLLQQARDLLTEAFEKSEEVASIKVQLEK